MSQRFNRASTLLVRFAYRRVSVGNVYIPALLVPQLLQPVRIGSFSVSYIQDHRDNPSDAHHGFFNSVDTALAGSFLGSQRSFTRILVRNATYTPLGSHLTLARQTQLGAILFRFAFQRVCPILTLFPCRNASSAAAVFLCVVSATTRKLGREDIGTASETGAPSLTTATGFPIGGNALFFNTVELRFPLFGANISGVFFHDMGNIYTGFSDISLAYKQQGNANFNYAVQAPGFGIRYKTPLGPLRVDFSYSLNPSKYLGYSSNLTIQQLDNNCGTGCVSGPQQLSHFNFFFSIGQAF